VIQSDKFPRCSIRPKWKHCSGQPISLTSFSDFETNRSNAFVEETTHQLQQLNPAVNHSAESLKRKFAEIVDSPLTDQTVLNKIGDTLLLNTAVSDPTILVHPTILNPVLFAGGMLLASNNLILLFPSLVARPMMSL
jgi:hypothetical protein